MHAEQKDTRQINAEIEVTIKAVSIIQDHDIMDQEEMDINKTIILTHFVIIVGHCFIHM